MLKEIHSSTILTIGKVGVGLLGFVYAFYVGRKLGPGQYSDFGLAMSIYYVVAVSNTPLRNLMTNFTRKYSSRNEDYKIRTLLRLILRVSGQVLALLFIPIILLSPQISNLFRLDTGPILVIVIFIMEALALIMNIYRGLIAGVERYWSLNLSLTYEAVLRLIFGIILLMFIPTSLGGVIAYPLAIGVVVGISVYQIRDIPPFQPHVKLNKREIWEYFLPLFLTSVTFATLYSLDSILAKYYLTKEHAGLYMAAGQISKFLYVIATSFNTVIINFSSESSAVNRFEKRKAFTVIGYYALITGGIILGLNILNKYLIVYTFGRDFIGSYALLNPLCAGVLFSGVSLMLCHFVMAFRFYWIYWIPVIATAVEFVAMYFFHASGQQLAWIYFLIQFSLAALLLLVVSRLKIASPQT